MRTFNNPLNINKLIVALRVIELDPYAQIETFIRPINDGGVTGDNCVLVDSTLSDLQIDNILSTTQTVEENVAVAVFADAIASFNAIPNWATMSTNDLVAAINAAFFNGLTQAQVQVTIDGIDTFPKLRSALTTLLTELYKTKDREIKHVLATAYMRDRLMRLRK